MQYGESSADIVFAAINAKYSHVALAPRCLLANLGELAGRAIILEAELRDAVPYEFAERILLRSPKVVSFSVYIWNVAFVEDVCRIIRAADPRVRIIAGGPQVVPGNHADDIASLVDLRMVGEGESIIGECISDQLGKYEANEPHAHESADGGSPDLSRIRLPYDLYTDDDLAHRIIYVETCRGCIFSCEYCTSSNSSGMRFFPLERLFAAFEKLMKRGVTHFKFLDRSFNQGGEHSLAVLDFFLRHYRQGMTLHFEFTPDIPGDEWRKRLMAFPPKSLHLEVGVQTLNRDVAARVKRPLNDERIMATLSFLINDAHQSVHADLIAGLPGESSGSIADGFNRLLALHPDELQFGILKNLPGCRMERHAEEFEMRFSPLPPYQIMSTKDIAFGEMCRLERFAKLFDRLHNRGKFPEEAERILFSPAIEGTPFARVMRLADHIFAKYGRFHALSPASLLSAIAEVFPPQGFGKAGGMGGLTSSAAMRR